VSDILPYVTAAAILVGMAVNLVGAVSAWRAREEAKAARVAAEESRAGMIEVNGKVYSLGRAVNGRLSELLDQTKKLAHAEGKLDEAQAQRDRQSEPQA
jgi:hypothetical protein